MSLLLVNQNIQLFSPKKKYSLESLLCEDQMVKKCKEVSHLYSDQYPAAHSTPLITDRCFIRRAFHGENMYRETLGENTSDKRPPEVCLYMC